MDPLEPESTDSGPTGAGQEGLPKSTMIAAGCAIVFTGLATFLIMKMGGSQAASDTLRTEIETIGATEATQRAELDTYEAQLAELKRRADVLFSGPIAFCNESEDPVTIRMLTATYMTEGDAFETFHSQPHGLNHWIVEPGERKVLAFSGGTTTFDGEAVYYSFVIQRPEGTYQYAGPRPPDDDWCVRWTGG